MKFPLVFAENGLVAYKGGELLARQVSVVTVPLRQPGNSSTLRCQFRLHSRLFLYNLEMYISVYLDKELHT